MLFGSELLTAKDGLQLGAEEEREAYRAYGASGFTPNATHTKVSSTLRQTPRNIENNIWGYGDRKTSLKFLPGFLVHFSQFFTLPFQAQEHLHGP